MQLNCWQQTRNSFRRWFSQIYLFASKLDIKKVPMLEITHNSIQLKQNSYVSYYGCTLDETMSGESMGYIVISRVNVRFKFLHRKSKYLTPKLRCLLCNVLIQPHFDHAYSQRGILNFLKNWKLKFKLHRIKASVSFCNWI